VHQLLKFAEDSEHLSSDDLVVLLACQQIVLHGGLVLVAYMLELPDRLFQLLACLLDGSSMLCLACLRAFGNLALVGAVHAMPTAAHLDIVCSSSNLLASLQQLLS